METGSTILPSGLYDYIAKDVRARILEKLMQSQHVDAEQFVDECIYFACRWLPEHTAGCRELDEFTETSDIVDSFRQECPKAEIIQTGQDTFTITFSNSYWTLHRNIWAKGAPLRISYKYHNHRAFVPMYKSPEILQYINSIIPEFWKIIRKLILEENRQMLVSLIEKTSAQVSHNK